MLSKTLSAFTVAVTVAASLLVPTVAFAQFPPPPPMVPAGPPRMAPAVPPAFAGPRSPAPSLAPGLAWPRELGRAPISPREVSGRGRLS